MSLKTLFVNGVNIVCVVTSPIGYRKILQQVPLGSNGVEERWTD